MQPPPKYVSLSAEQAEVFMSELHRSSLEPSIAVAIAQIIRTSMWLIWSLRETTLSLTRYRQMVFGPPAKAPQTPCAQSEPDVDRGAQSSLSSLEHRPAAPEPRRRGGHQPGQGRLGAAVYVGAKRIACRHDE